MCLGHASGRALIPGITSCPQKPLITIMTKREFLSLTDKYNQGICSPEEKEVIERFCEKVQLQEISARWDLSEEEAIRIRLLTRILKSVDQTEADPRQAQGKDRSLRVVWRVAAAVAFMAVLSGLYLAYQAQHAVRYVTKAAARGERTTVTLSDGSVVRLNAESTITFPEHFRATTREIALQGEAFFEVAKDPEKPFVITTGNLTTTVLGTSFNVQAYPESTTITVTVATGKVRVEGRNRKALIAQAELLPGQQAVYDTKTSAIAKAQVALDKYLAWKDDIILLDRVTMGEAAALLSRWYNAEIIFENDAIRNCVINGEFRNDALANVMENLQFLTGMEYKILPGNRVVISGKSCH